MQGGKVKKIQDKTRQDKTRQDKTRQGNLDKLQNEFKSAIL
jgi:hypothetical protein